jgi:hypothetical protein
MEGEEGDRAMEGEEGNRAMEGEEGNRAMEGEEGNRAMEGEEGDRAMEGEEGEGGTGLWKGGGGERKGRRGREQATFTNPLCLLQLPPSASLLRGVRVPMCLAPPSLWYAAMTAQSLVSSGSSMPGPWQQLQTWISALLLL